MFNSKKVRDRLFEEKGFTIVETLISVTIAGIILLVAAGFIKTTSNGYAYTESYFICRNEADIVLAKMAGELEKAGAGLNGSALFTTTVNRAVIAKPSQINNPQIVFFYADVAADGVVSAGDYWVRYSTDNFRVTREVRKFNNSNDWPLLLPLTPPSKKYLTSPNVKVEALTFTIYNSSADSSTIDSESNSGAIVDNTAAAQIKIMLTLSKGKQKFIFKKRVLLKNVMFGGGA